MTSGLLQPEQAVWEHLGLHMQTPPEIGFGQKTRQRRNILRVLVVNTSILQWTNLAMILYSSHTPVMGPVDLNILNLLEVL